MFEGRARGFEARVRGFKFRKIRQLRIFDTFYPSTVATRRDVRAAGEAAGELLPEGVEAGVAGAEGFQDAIDVEAVFHDVAALSHLGVVGEFPEGGEPGEAGPQFIEAGEIGFGKGEIGDGVGREFAGVLPGDDEGFAAEGLALGAHLVELAALFDGEVHELGGELGLEDGEGGVDGGPVGVGDVEGDEVLGHGVCGWRHAIPDESRIPVVSGVPTERRRHGEKWKRNGWPRASANFEGGWRDLKIPFAPAEKGCSSPRAVLEPTGDGRLLVVSLRGFVRGLQWQF